MTCTQLGYRSFSDGMTPSGRNRRGLFPSSAPVSAGFEEGLRQVMAGGRNAGQRKEVTAAKRFDVLLQWLAIEFFLHRNKALLQIGLITDK